MRRDPRREPTFLTTRESADRLGVSVNAIKAWIREDELPALRTPGGHHRIAEADLETFRVRLRGRSRGSPGHARVLAVDDDPRLLGAIQEALHQVLAGAAVEVATDGYEALVKVGSFRPDVLVLDIRMPQLDGFEVCRRLKAGPGTRGIRIVAMTAYPDETVRERILACGADELLEKPFPLDRLRAVVQQLLGRGVAR